MSAIPPVDTSGSKIGCSFLLKSNCCSKVKNEDDEATVTLKDEHDQTEEKTKAVARCRCIIL